MGYPDIVHLPFEDRYIRIETSSGSTLISREAAHKELSSARRKLQDKTSKNWLEFFLLQKQLKSIPYEEQLLQAAHRISRHGVSDG